MTVQLNRRHFLGTAAAGAIVAGAASLRPKFAFAKDSFVNLDAMAQAELVRKKEVTSLELVEAAIGRIEAVNGKVNAVVYEAFDMARAAEDAMVITAPCDMPDLPDDMAAQLLAAPTADVVYFKGERDYPLCALWRISVADDLRRALQQADGGLAVMRFLATQTVHTIPVSDDTAFVNINHPPLAAG